MPRELGRRAHDHDEQHRRNEAPDRLTARQVAQRSFLRDPGQVAFSLVCPNPSGRADGADADAHADDDKRAVGRAAEARLVSVFCAAFVAAGFYMALGVYSGKRACS